MTYAKCCNVNCHYFDSPIKRGGTCPFPELAPLTFEIEVDVCIAVAERVERVASVHSGVGKAGVLDGEGQHVPVLLRLEAFVADASVLFNHLKTNGISSDHFVPLPFRG